ncbi:MFS transporter [Caenispirillum salinarum]|uniref:MFS transporter n=1 Tax=Caenispirillum salinarum TaxID=859058 RepID=UPI0038507C3B
MRAILVPIIALLTGAAFLMLGNGLMGTLTSLRLDMAGASATVVGIVNAGYFGGLTLGALFAERVIRRVGHIRAFAALASVYSGATLAHALEVDPWIWLTLRFVEGFCMAGLFICVESWLNHRATNVTRGQILSSYAVTIYFAQFLGQFLLNLPDETGFLLFVVISILMSIAVVPVAMTTTPIPTLPEVASFSFKRLWKVSPLGVYGAGVGGIVFGASYGLAPVFTQKLGYSVSETATFVSATILGGLIIQYPIGKLSDLLDRRVVLVSLFIAQVAISGLMIGATYLGFWYVVGCAVMFGGISFTLYPLSLSHANDHLESHELVAAAGGLLLTYSLGATIGPLFVSPLMDAIGPNGLFAVLLGLGVVSSVFAAWRVRARPSVPMEEQGKYHVVPRTSAVSAAMDPRGEDADGQLSFDFDFRAEADAAAEDQRLAAE